MKLRLIYLFLLCCSSSVFANTEIRNCSIDNSGICLVKNSEGYFIETSNNERVLNYSENINHSKGYTLTQEIENIEEVLFNQKLKINNHNGLLVAKNLDGDIYTARIGYLLDNFYYKPLINNIVKEFKKEDFNDVKKYKSKERLVALNNGGELYYKNGFGEWKRIDIDKVYDFKYTNKGDLFILSDNGFFMVNITIFNTVDIYEFSFKDNRSKLRLQKDRLDIKSKLKDRDIYLRVKEDNSFVPNHTRKEDFFNYEISIKSNDRYYYEVDLERKDVLVKDRKDWSRNISTKCGFSGIDFNDRFKAQRINYFKDNHYDNYFSYQTKSFLPYKMKKSEKDIYQGFINFNNPEKIPAYTIDSLSGIMDYSEEKIIYSKEKDGVRLTLRENGVLEIYNESKKELLFLEGVTFFDWSEKENDFIITYGFSFEKDVKEVSFFENNWPNRILNREPADLFNFYLNDLNFINDRFDIIFYQYNFR